MDTLFIREKLFDVLAEIQADCELECPELSGNTKPVEDIPQFDSKVWPVAITLLAKRIGAVIPNDVNIFQDEQTRQARSVDEICAYLREIQETQDRTAAVEV